MFGNIEEMQSQMRESLKAITVETQAGGGVIKLEGNAARELTNIKIDPDFLKEAETEEVEDLLLVAFNELITKATEAEATQSQEMLKNIMPPGMGGLSNLFG